ncbi:hypothetical protein JQX13_07930 [Archangium violaceum]|uniref:hypothetical protein n=1 Tax=Archangium violaceum TaxID=83451 RepID=UPI00193B55BF|nr:hypothetical protein [Archangium violaceum]QRK10016.1 hypothetical protein JQX13_07930 [Archangium violaceum]
MSHAGNITGNITGNTKGGPGSPQGQVSPRSSEGGLPGRPDRSGPGSGAAREEKTRIGRAPTQPELPRPGGQREPKSEAKEAKSDARTGIWNFAQDGLEMGGPPRSGRTREGRSSGVFEGARSTREGSGSTRAVPERWEGSASPAHPTETPRTTETSHKGDGFVPVPVMTPGGPEAPEVAKPLDAKPLEELLPEFPEAIGQESLAHHLDEELRFLGAELRPSRLPPSERAARLWAFFIAYARANAKDPAGQSAAGRERFQEVLTRHGFGDLRDVDSGRDGVEVALELLEARSPEELKARLSGVRIEPRPERLSSEVFLPVVEAHHLARPDSQVAGTPVLQEQKDSPFEAPPERAPPPAVQPGLVLPGVALAAQGVAPNPEDMPASGLERRGSRGRLGPHMLWNALHGLRDSPEDSSLLQEKWSQAAFGAVIALAGAALLVGMLASL